MKKIIIIIMVLLIPALCHADRVCIEKSTGKLIEYQSGNAPLGTLFRNATNAGYDKNDIEEKYVNSGEWYAIWEVQIDRPIKNRIKQEKKAAEDLVPALLLKLGLTEQDWKDLKRALK